MRWAIIGASGEDSFEFHLHDTLLHLGHDSRSFDLTLGPYHPRLAHYWWRRISKDYDYKKGIKLAEEILKYEPDIVLAVYRHIHPVTIEKIKQVAPTLPVIHVNQDNLCTLEQQQVLASAYDHLFTKDPYMVRTFRDKAGLNVHYLPESFNPRYHKPPAANRKELEQEVDTDILVFGTMYPYRSRFIEKIIKPDRKIRIFGTPGPFFSGPLTTLFANRTILTTEKSKMIYGSRIVLNNFFYGEIEGVNCKYFEIFGSGGFQVCDYKDVLSEYSPVIPSTYAFHSVAEANDIIDHFLSRPNERHAMAETQLYHFRTHHTYENRIQTILEVTGLFR